MDKLDGWRRFRGCRLCFSLTFDYTVPMHVIRFAAAGLQRLTIFIDTEVYRMRSDRKEQIL